MARAQLEYDESGSTFYYFLISFYGIVLLPITYFLWPRKDDDGKRKALVCHCEPCQMKKTRLETEQPKKRFKTYLKYAVLIVLWALFFVMIYKVLTLEKDYIEYDPFEILQIDPGASMGEIKKQYRKLSKVYHPDKEGGDQDMFMKIAKAYEALTDDVSRENWEKYGNPDGPQAATFGIALPSWIVSEENSIWLLLLYIGVFVFGLPIIVGVWWYSTIKYGTTNILIQTTRIFFILLSRSKNTPIKRIVAILTSAMEFNPQLSQVVKARPSDDEELTEIIRMKLLPHIDIKTKERPFCAPYASKARILTHAHLGGHRNLLPQHTLQHDQYALLRRCPQLIQEIVNVLGQAWYFGKDKRGPGTCTVPSLETFENVMKVSQMVVQGMWSRGNSCLFQMPHITADQVKHFRTKKRNITSIHQFVAMKNADRRALVRTLSDDEYHDVMAMCSMVPHVDITAETQVVDDTDHDRITAGSLVTLSVQLKRTDLLNHCGISIDELMADDLSNPSKESPPPHDGDVDDEDDEVETLFSGEHEMKRIKANSTGSGGGAQAAASQKKSWEKSKKKKKGKGGIGAGKSKKKAQQKKGGKKQASNAQQERAEDDAEQKDEEKDNWGSDNEEEAEPGEANKIANKRTPKGKKKYQRALVPMGGGGSGGKNNVRLRTRGGGSNSRAVALRDDGSSDDESDVDSEPDGEGGERKDDEEEWKSLQESMQKHQKKKFDSIDTKSHPVHAPFFPDEKQECWWLYVADKKKKEMITPPQRIVGFKDEHSTELHIPAPDKTGCRRYTVFLMSDSYIDMVFSKDVKFDVHEKQEVVGKDQWKELEEEEEEQEVIEESDEETEGGFTETESD